MSQGCSDDKHIVGMPETKKTELAIARGSQMRTPWPKTHVKGRPRVSQAKGFHHKAPAVQSDQRPQSKRVMRRTIAGLCHADISCALADSRVQRKATPGNHFCRECRDALRIFLLCNQRATWFDAKFGDGVITSAKPPEDLGGFPRM